LFLVNKKYKYLSLKQKLLLLQADDDWVVFLFKKGDNSELQQKKFKNLPQRVQAIVREPTTLLPYVVHRS